MARNRLKTKAVEDEIMPATMADYYTCNGCGTPFRRDGYKLSYAAFAAHKKTCVEVTRKAMEEDE